MLALSYDYLQIAENYLKRHGVDQSQLKLLTDADQGAPSSDGMVTWTVEQYRSWVNALKSLSGDATIGVRLGQEFNITAHGQLGQIALSGENIWQVLGLLDRYTPIRNHLLTMEWRQENDLAVLEFKTLLDDIDLNQFATEVAIGTMLDYCAFF